MTPRTRRVTQLASRALACLLFPFLLHATILSNSQVFAIDTDLLKRRTLSVASSSAFQAQAMNSRLTKPCFFILQEWRKIIRAFSRGLQAMRENPWTFRAG
ncbi:hypothetical protein IWX49DRAFT_254545 [Phyllosticta citricarpa]